MMKTIVTRVSFGSNECLLVIDHSHCSAMIIDYAFKNLADLVKAYPELTIPIQINAFCLIANFLFTGLSYEVIENCQSFKKVYAQRIKRKDKLVSYGEFNLRAMHLPKVIENQALFFVEEIATGIPYQVSCPFPYLDSNAPFAYHLLPYV